jgi:hypothetical protein
LSISMRGLLSVFGCHACVRCKSPTYRLKYLDFRNNSGEESLRNLTTSPPDALA